tara:strand:+ start:562 stop:879 length:318 start_codon:yes stop_codon:yes gene_type:complete
MAYFQYQSETDKDCLLTSFKSLLENAGLLVSEEFSSAAQVFAENQSGQIDYKTKVKVFISWFDKSVRICLIEIRSDEPFSKKDTYCEQVANQLRGLIPPKDLITY